MKRIWLGALIFGFLTIVGVGAASAQYTAFMLVPGIPGSSVDERHKDWIDVTSVAQTLTPVALRRERGYACNVTVVKALDAAGPQLWLSAVTGQVFTEVRIEVTRGDGRDAAPFYTLRLGNVRISSLQTNVDSTAYPVEQLVLVPESATLEVRTQKPDGTFGPPVATTFSCGL